MDWANNVKFVTTRPAFMGHNIFIYVTADTAQIHNSMDEMVI